MSVQFGTGVQIGTDVQVGTNNQSTDIKESEVVGSEPPNTSHKEIVRPSKLDETDRLTLDLSKAQRQIALAEAKTALSNNEKAELQYKYVVLQIYMKYGLTAADALNEDGTILYNGANNNE